MEIWVDFTYFVSFFSFHNCTKDKDFLKKKIPKPVIKEVIPTTKTNWKLGEWKQTKDLKKTQF